MRLSPYPSFIRATRLSPEPAIERVYLASQVDSGTQIVLKFWETFSTAENCPTLRVFYKRAFEYNQLEDGRLPGVAVDEVEKKLYILWGPGPYGMTIDVCGLRFKLNKGTGLLRVSATDGFSVKIKQDIQKLLAKNHLHLFPFHSLNINPDDGVLYASCVVRQTNKTFKEECHGNFPARIRWANNCRAASLEPLADVAKQDFCLSAYQSDVLRFIPPLFTRDCASLVYWHPHDNGCQERMATSDERDRNAQFGMVPLKAFKLEPSASSQTTAHLDPLPLVSMALPKDLLASVLVQLPFLASHLTTAAAHLRCLGRIDKFWIFYFGTYAIAVKWTRDWYKDPNLCTVELTVVLPLQKDLAACRAIRSIMVCDGSIYFLTQDFSDAKPPTVVRYTPNLSSYRECAGCGVLEKKKTRKPDHKRKSSFKVCRECKERGYHRFPNVVGPPCHFCSAECHKKNWKEHKKVVHKA